MARSILSLGILTDLAFCITARKRELLSGSGPPSLTPITMSFPIRVKALLMAAHRVIFLALRNSNALPIKPVFFNKCLQIYKNLFVVWNVSGQKVFIGFI